MSPLPGKMGAITGMSVEARSSSGSILTLDLTYECGIVKIKTEYNIRKILRLYGEKIVYADATESENITMLPSAFSTVEKQEDGTYLLSGGGYGHGLGMSQNGANGMAKSRYGLSGYLKLFYQGYYRGNNRRDGRKRDIMIWKIIGNVDVVYGKM